MDRDDTPGALDEELFPECGPDYAVVADEAVRIDESAAADAGDDNTESSAEHLREVSVTGVVSKLILS